MSHFTRLKTTLSDRDVLVAALEELGYSVEVGDVRIRGWMNQHSAVDVKIATSNPGYDIGFQRTGDSYEIVADWYGIPNETAESLLAKVAPRYAYLATRQALEAQGFSISDEIREANGEVRIVLRRMT